MKLNPIFELKGDANDPADDPMHTHMWCNDKLNKSLVESFWNNFKAEQLASVVEGDIIWDYSQIIDMKIPSLPDVKKRGGGVVARYTDFDYNENDDNFESVTNRGSKSGTVKPKLVCVTKNFRTFNKLDGDLAELMVFDGTEVRVCFRFCVSIRQSAFFVQLLCYCARRIH